MAEGTIALTKRDPMNGNGRGRITPGSGNVPSELITKEACDAVLGGVRSRQPELGQAHDRERAGEAGERLAAPDPVEASKAGECHDFPYFEVYPYGYLY